MTKLHNGTIVTTVKEMATRTRLLTSGEYKVHETDPLVLVPVILDCEHRNVATSCLSCGKAAEYHICGNESYGAKFGKTIIPGKDCHRCKHAVQEG